MQTMDELLGHIRKRAIMDIEQNRSTTGKDYSPAVGWLLEHIAMKSRGQSHYFEMGFPMNIMFESVPELKERIKRFGKGGGDEVQFHETMKCAVAIDSWLGECNTSERIDLITRVDKYGLSLQIIDGHMYHHLDPVESGPAYELSPEELNR